MTIMTESGGAAGLAVSGRFCGVGGTLSCVAAVVSVAAGVTGSAAWLAFVVGDAGPVTDAPVPTGTSVATAVVDGFGGLVAATSVGLTGGGSGGGGGVFEPLADAGAGAVMAAGVAASSRAGDGLTLK